MKTFLRETWELWYWAMFCPSLLQQRMNERSPNPGKDGQKPDTTFSDILLFGSGRFISQYLLLLLIFTIPLAIAIGKSPSFGPLTTLRYCFDEYNEYSIIYKREIMWWVWCPDLLDWVLLPIVIFLAYCIGFWFFPLGIHTPLLWGLVYLEAPKHGFKWLYDKAQGFIELYTPFLLLEKTQNSIILGITVSVVTIVIISLLGLKLLKLDRIVLAQYLVAIGGAFGLLFGSLLANQNLISSLIVSAATYFSFRTDIYDRHNEIKSTKMGDFVSRLFISPSLIIVAYIAYLASWFNNMSFSILNSPIYNIPFIGGILSFVSAIILTFIVWVSLAIVFCFGLTALTVGAWELNKLNIFAFVIPIALAFSIAFSSLPIFLVSCWLLTFSLAKPHTRWKIFAVWTIIGLLVWVGLEHLGWLSLLAAPVALIGYYRVFPEYLILASVSRSFSFPLQLIFSKLPPEAEKLLWEKMPSRDRILVCAFCASPIAELANLIRYKHLSPEYEQILVSAFYTTPTAELANLIRTRPSLSPESKRTLKKVLPQIIATQLASVDTITELIAVAKLGNPILIYLLNQLEIPALRRKNLDISVILPELIGIAEELEAPVKTGNKTLDSCSPQTILKLEQILNSLEFLSLKYVKIGIDVPEETKKNCQLVFDRWQQIIELELEEEKKKFYAYLPQAVADTLADVTTISQLIATATPDHPVLPLLVPTFYQAKPELGESSSSLTNSPINSEIAEVLPRLQIIANDIARAMEAGSAGLRQRSLERIVNDFPRQKLELLLRELKIWLPVLDQWERVITQELKQQQAQSQGEVINPFQAGQPLLSNRNYLFQGRRELADEIVRMVLDKNRPTLVIHGPRRFGKTSFLYNLSRLLPRNILSVYMDMQSSGVTSDDAAFCRGLIYAIHRDVRSQERLELPAVPPRQHFLDNTYITLEDWLEQALGRLQENQRILLNLDEFEKIGNAVREGRLSERLFNELRHLIQHCEPLSFLFAGVQTLEELGPNWSSYFISVKSMEIDYLKPDEAEKLLRDPDPEFPLSYNAGVIGEILNLTRCHPYLVQLIGENLVKLANARQTREITSDLLQAAIPEAFNTDVGYFINVWEEYTGTNPKEVAAGRKLLLALARGLQLNPAKDDKMTQSARQRLRRYHVIEQTNRGDRFEVPMLERWVKERAVLN